MLGFAWTLVAMCCLHHAGHALHDLGFHAVAHLPLLHAMGMNAPLDGAFNIPSANRSINQSIHQATRGWAASLAASHCWALAVHSCSMGLQRS